VHDINPSVNGSNMDDFDTPSMLKAVEELDPRNYASALALLLVVIVAICALAFGCRDSGVIWSAESRSPDGHWLASASTEHR
jgi:hypothetical protein